MLVYQTLENCQTKSAKSLWMWMLEKFIATHKKIKTFNFRSPFVASLLGKFERGIEWMMYEIINNFSLTEILGHISDGYSEFTFMKNFFEGLLSKEQHELSLFKSLRKIIGLEIHDHTDVL
mmetsp:Transcript_16311/g.13975  ORF Transcript_16311/g.13975 Transcript_16311/m.13975 type:complete len:121 (-) Transcript_16311:557-919(-)